MGNFVSIEFSQSERALAAEAEKKLIELMEAHGFPGITYSEADFEIIFLEVLAGMALSTTQVASVAPDAIFRQFGTQLLNLPFNEGTSATGRTKWTIAPSEGVRHIPAGTQIEATSLGFYVETEQEVPAKATSIEIQVVALERGTAYNKVTGEAQQVNPLDYVLAVEFVGETTGGEEEETDSQYLERLAEVLALQAPRPITAENYAAFVLNAPEAIAGVKVGRATAIDGYKEGTEEHEAKVTSTSTKMKEVASYAGVTVGTEIIGAGVPLGTYVEKLTEAEESAKELTMSAAATATEAKKAYKFKGTYENQRYVTTFVANAEGKELTSEQMTKLETWLKTYRELNFHAIIEKPSYNKITIIAEVKVLPSYTGATVKVGVESALRAFINPATWGAPESKTNGGAGGWLNYVNGERLFSIVRYNDVLSVIGNVPGVAYVKAGSAGLKIGLEVKPPTGTSDIQMIGPAPLPELYPASEATERFEVKTF